MSTHVTKLGTISENMSANIVGAVDWTNLNNALTTDSVYTSVSFSEDVNSNYLYIHDFDINIPTTAVIEGIQISVKKRASGPVADLSAGLIYLNLNDITITSPDKAIVGNWSGIPIIVNYGGPTDLWNKTWTAEELNDTTFGFALAASGDGSSGNAAEIDYILLDLYYHQVINHIPTGGARLAGTAAIQSSTTVTSTAAIIISGHAPEVHNFITFGGTLVSGSALHIHGLYAYGGSTANSSSTPLATYNHTPTQGARGNGRATFTYNINGSGGIAANGSATFVSSFWMMGGLNGDGSSGTYFAYNISITAIGALLAGHPFVDPVLPEGGISGSGTATIQVEYNQSGAGGASLNSSATTLLFFGPTGGIAIDGGCSIAIWQHVDGGAQLSGEALVKPYVESMRGGARVAPIAFIDPYMATGGSTASGSATITSIWQTGTLADEFSFYCTGRNDIPSDTTTKVAVASVRINIDTNTVAWEIRHNFTTGKIRFHGPATESETADPLIFLDGSTSPVIGSMVLPDVTESGLLSGLGYLRLTENLTSAHIRGQLTNRNGRASGDATYQSTFTKTVSGGGTLAGVAQVVLTKTEIALGGAISSGIGSIGTSHVIVPGCRIGGSATINYLSIPVITGGAKVAGGHTFGVICNVTPSGGATISGQSIIAINVVVGSSGPLIAGTATVARTLFPIISGGGRLAGTLVLNQTYAAQSSIGGIRIFGRWVVDYLKPITSSPHRGYALAMKTANILNAEEATTNALIINRAASPILDENRFNVAHQPGWCDFGESCDSAYLPKIVQNRQGTHLPSKSGTVVTGNDQITKFS